MIVEGKTYAVLTGDLVRSSDMSPEERKKQTGILVREVEADAGGDLAALIDQVALGDLIAHAVF